MSWNESVSDMAYLLTCLRLSCLLFPHHLTKKPLYYKLDLILQENIFQLSETNPWQQLCPGLNSAVIFAVLSLEGLLWPNLHFLVTFCQKALQNFIIFVIFAIFRVFIIFTVSSRAFLDLICILSSLFVNALQNLVVFILRVFVIFTVSSGAFLDLVDISSSFFVKGLTNLQNFCYFWRWRLVIFTVLLRAFLDLIYISSSPFVKDLAKFRNLCLQHFLIFLNFVTAFNPGCIFLAALMEGR